MMGLTGYPVALSQYKDFKSLAIQLSNSENKVLQIISI